MDRREENVGFEKNGKAVAPSNKEKGFVHLSIHRTILYAHIIMDLNLFSFFKQMPDSLFAH